MGKEKVTITEDVVRRKIELSIPENETRRGIIETKAVNSAKSKLLKLRLRLNVLEIKDDNIKVFETCYPNNFYITTKKNALLYCALFEEAINTIKREAEFLPDEEEIFEIHPTRLTKSTAKNRKS